MTLYSVQPKNRMYVKGHGFFSFAKDMGRNIGKRIIKKLSSKYNQNLIVNNKTSATDALKTASKIQKAAEVTGDLIRNKIADKITRVSKTSPKNYSETNKEILGERYVSRTERENYEWAKIIILI